MYYVLMDSKTGGIYMPPADISFFVYTDPEACAVKPLKTFLLGTEYDTLEEIKTVMWRVGFLRGFVDDEPVDITPNDIMVLDRNANDLYYSQYLLTKKDMYLEGITIKNLYTLCKLEGDDAIFPTVEKNDIFYILAYTDKRRISKELINKYPDYKIIRTSFKAPFVLNEDVFIRNK